MAEHFTIIVTDVTIYGQLRCVAGWDPNRKVMIRPEPKAGEFWSHLLCGERTTFNPGHVVEFIAEKPDTSLPHNSEDWVVKGNPRKNGSLSGEQFRKVLEESLAIGLPSIGNHLRFAGSTAFVLEGAACGSLCGLMVPRESVRVISKKDAAGLMRARCWLEVGERKVDLSIAAKNLRHAFRDGGIEAVNKCIEDKNLYLRLGLARALDHNSGERRCYLQINGIYPLNGS